MLYHFPFKTILVVLTAIASGRCSQVRSQGCKDIVYRDHMTAGPKEGFSSVERFGSNGQNWCRL